MILAQTAAAADQGTRIGEPNVVAMAFFFGFIAVTIGITYWAARRTRTTEEFYAAGRTITAGQNGFALAGDYMSAASFLGIAGLVSTTGFDGLIYSTGWLVGWPVVLFLIAEPLRNLGRYTFADVVASRLKQAPVRIAAATGTLATVTFYLIAQMVGAGGLIRLMFGLNYEIAIMIVGAAMLAYVLFGGMIATTWVQIVKAVLLLGGAALLALLVLSKFGFNPARLFAAAAEQHGAGVLAPGRLVAAARCGLAGHGADVRHCRAAAYPDAFLHRARRANRAEVGVLRDRTHRVLLPNDVRPRIRGDGTGRARRHPRRGCGGQHGRSAPG
jgi:cation/acetate symporter